MQKLVRAMRIALGTQHATNHHLRFGETLGQHVHQRNGAALADIAAGRAKAALRGGVQRLLKPRCGAGRIPAGGTGG